METVCRVVIWVAGLVVAVVLFTGCAGAPQYHKTMMCSQVGHNLLMCMDGDEWDSMQKHHTAPEPVAPRRGPQRAPLDLDEAA